ncbi:MAG TPA: 5-formyltetrahydrofolate cyclo-ligase [bacterium]|nr:5-formyltetrahydrofolate cyclo-ligase [bacterium]
MDRNAIRRQVLQRRDALQPAQRQAKSDAIWKRLVEFPAFQQARSAFFYVTHGSEVDTTLMRRMARELGMRVAAPRSKPGDYSMAFHWLESEDGLVPGAYGILQPEPSAPVAELAPDVVVLVPGLAFDARGNRIGFGGGYYDRWLAGPGRGAVTVGLAFEEQLLDGVDALPHDRPVDGLVTDQRSFDCAALRL